MIRPMDGLGCFLLSALQGVLFHEPIVRVIPNARGVNLKNVSHMSMTVLQASRHCTTWIPSTWSPSPRSNNLLASRAERRLPPSSTSVNLISPCSQNCHKTQPQQRTPNASSTITATATTTKPTSQQSAPQQPNLTNSPQPPTSSRCAAS